MTFNAATDPGVNPPPPAATRGFAPARCAGEEPDRVDNLAGSTQNLSVNNVDRQPLARNDRCGDGGDGSDGSDGVEAVHRPHSRELLPAHTDTPGSPTVACSTVIPWCLQYASVFLSSCLTGRNRHQAPAPRSGTMGMGKFWT